MHVAAHSFVHRSRRLAVLQGRGSNNRVSVRKRMENRRAYLNDRLTLLAHNQREQVTPREAASVV